MKEPPYDEGDELELTIRFTDAADEPADPDEVKIELICPDGTQLSWEGVELDHFETGFFSARYTVENGFGWYRVTARGAGGVTIVRQESFPVQESQAQEAFASA